MPLHMEMRLFAKGQVLEEEGVVKGGTSSPSLVPPPSTPTPPTKPGGALYGLDFTVSGTSDACPPALQGFSPLLGGGLASRRLYYSSASPTPPSSHASLSSLDLSGAHVYEPYIRALLGRAGQEERVLAGRGRGVDPPRPPGTSRVCRQTYLACLAYGLPSGLDEFAIS